MYIKDVVKSLGNFNHIYKWLVNKTIFHQTSEMAMFSVAIVVHGHDENDMSFL